MAVTNKMRDNCIIPLWRSYMSHFPFLDRNKTIEKAKSVLNDYEKIHALELSTKVSIKSPIISDIPKSAPVGNSQEDKVLNGFEVRQYACFFSELIRDVVETIQDETYKEIIKELYIKCSGNDVYVMSKVHLERTQYYSCKSEALLTFAQVMPPFKDIDNKLVDLLVYK